MVLQIRGLRKCRSFIESINRGGVKKSCKTVLINNMVAGFLIVSLLPMKELGKECNRSLFCFVQLNISTFGIISTYLTSILIC